MVVLGLDDLALMLFDFGSRGLEDFHIHDVVAAVHAIRPVPADEHADFLWDSFSRHVANTSSAQVVKLQPNVLCFFLRLAR
jgi:hypothetical protein